MILPLHLILKLKISHTHKFGLFIVFSLGGIIIAFAFVRLAQVTRATSDTIQDPTIVASGPVLLSMWSHVESSVAVHVAALPAFRFLLKKNRVKLKESNKHYDPTIDRPGTSLRSKERQKGRARLGDDGASALGRAPNSVTGSD